MGALIEHLAELRELRSHLRRRILNPPLRPFLALGLSHRTPIAAVAAAGILPILAIAIGLPFLHVIENVVEPLLLLGLRHREELIHPLLRTRFPLTAVHIEERPPLAFRERLHLLPELIAQLVALSVGKICRPAFGCPNPAASLAPGPYRRKTQTPTPLPPMPLRPRSYPRWPCAYS